MKNTDRGGRDLLDPEDWETDDVWLNRLSEVLREYRRLQEGLSDMVEDVRLVEADIPDDYRWLVEQLVKLAGLDPLTAKESR